MQERIAVIQEAVYLLERRKRKDAVALRLRLCKDWFRRKRASKRFNIKLNFGDFSFFSPSTRRRMRNLIASQSKL
ncbi:hypothetical protein IEQ34_011554 [Dendrobium chrysotoxum]|uniref:Uncharacterized protein n=1 Tax=Dendrobium chrysotoxum TaxID=161865 RepID=A0AAV7GR22_DENCH|nr:hypothetical protein IEQ34_011554 [Dendrobium chrysotoxum]